MIHSREGKPKHWFSSLFFYFLKRMPDGIRKLSAKKKRNEYNGKKKKFSEKNVNFGKDEQSESNDPIF